MISSIIVHNSVMDIKECCRECRRLRSPIEKKNKMIRLCVMRRRVVGNKRLSNDLGNNNNNNNNNKRLSNDLGNLFVKAGNPTQSAATKNQVIRHGTT